MKALVVIPARGGSKGLPGKNIKPLKGKPLIHYTIEAAREVFDDNQIIVSTDSEEIKEVAEDTGIQVPFLRPDYLATDTATSQDTLLHALDYYCIDNEPPEVVVLLQVTSPLRNGVQVKEALDLYASDIDMVVSVKETTSNPYYVLFEEDKNGFLERTKKASFTRRQDCPKVWELNGAIYIINVNSLRNNSFVDFEKMRKYPMDERSSIDIDNQLDFDWASFILDKK